MCVYVRVCVYVHRMAFGRTLTSLSSSLHPPHTQNNKKGGKMYIQDKMEEYADEIFDRLAKVRRPAFARLSCCVDSFVHSWLVD